MLTLLFSVSACVYIHMTHEDACVQSMRAHTHTHADVFMYAVAVYGEQRMLGMLPNDQTLHTTQMPLEGPFLLLLFTIALTLIERAIRERNKDTNRKGEV